MLVIGLFGPTASGKSDVAAAITELLPSEVVSADAMQVYDGLPILTNRSPHPERLVGIWPLSHLASVGEYAPLAHSAIDEILAAGRTPLVVGGTGLYFRAALAELELPPRRPPARVSGGVRSTTRPERVRRTLGSARSTRPQPPGSIRTIVAVSFARSSSRKQVTRSCRGATASLAAPGAIPPS